MRFWFVIATYVVFLIAYRYTPLPVVAALWFICAVGTTIKMLQSAPDDRPSWLGRWILLSSLAIWPIQIATLSAAREDEAESKASRRNARLAIGNLPAQISGTISFDDYIDAEDPYYLIWIEEFEELSFQVSVDLYESIGIAEGSQVSLTVDERESEDGATVVYVVDGQLAPG